MKMPKRSEFVIAVDDPREPACRALLDAHLEFAREHSPPEHVYALDLEGLLAENITFFSNRDATGVVGVGALLELDKTHVEIKSMHTAKAARGRGVARAMLDHLLCVARARGYLRISLETGSEPAFVPARALYSSRGFTTCPPFGDHVADPISVCMTLELTPG